MDACLKVFDSCACYPGLLKCAQIKCLDDSDDVQQDCEDFQKSSTVCSTTCEPLSFPTARGAKNILEVQSTCSIVGVTKDEFVTNYQESFIRITAEIAKVKIEQVVDVEVKDVARRLAAALRRLASGGIEIDFTIVVDSPEALEATQQELVKELSATSDNSTDSAPSIFAQKLQEEGIIDDASAFTVTGTKTVVTVVSSNDDEEYAEEAKEEEGKDGVNTTIIAAAAGGAAAVILLLLYCCCCRKQS